MPHPDEIKTRAGAIATAQIDGSVFGLFGKTEAVDIRKSRARRCVAQFHAPGWRPMAFASIEAAKAKLSRHPGFVAWAAQ